MNDGILNWNVDPEIFWITDSFPLKYYGLLFMICIKSKSRVYAYKYDNFVIIKSYTLYNKYK